MGSFCTVNETNGSYGWKSPIFSTPRLFYTPVEGVPIEIL